MSGICGIVRFDGMVVDRPALHAMTSAMAFRGPDAQNVWLGGQVGLGHTLLRTTFESKLEQQPASLNGEIWITADARIDGQDELKAKLRSVGRQDVGAARDEELILHAYHVWGQDCVQHLIGDFAFAIWDIPKKLVFCARDQFGIKPFFYARTGTCLIFSNTLECLRIHPDVSGKLDDHFVGDFLLFAQSFYPERTAFADIRRLPAAHTLTWSAVSGLHVDQYWRLPTDIEVEHRAAGDYVERFTELLEMSVSDRLRTDRVCVAMSGGLDSTSLAAVAQSLLGRRGAPFALSAHAVVYDRLIPDKERYYSSLAARHIGIPMHYCVADDYRLFERWRETSRTPEPVHNPRRALSTDAAREIALLGRVALTGWDGDALLSESLRPRLRLLAKRRQYATLVRDLLGYLVVESKMAASGWESFMRRLSPQPKPARSINAYPEWIEPEFERAIGLRQRWREIHTRSTSAHRTRPYAYASLEGIQAESFFDGYDASWTRSTVEYRHPLMDLRLLTYCLSLPHQPWALKKHILREAMRGMLPEEVRTRPKSPLAGEPMSELAKRCSPATIDALHSSTLLRSYVKDGKVSPQSPLDTSAGPIWYQMTPISLQCWVLATGLDQHSNKAYMADTNMNTQGAKVYTSPQITEFGSVKTLTQSKGNASLVADNANPNATNTKTH